MVTHSTYFFDLLTSPWHRVICLLLAPSAGEPILYMAYMPLKSKIEPLRQGIIKVIKL